MIHALLAIFIVAHGAVHGIMFGLPLLPSAEEDMAQRSFHPATSWLFGETPLVGFVWGLGVTIAFVVAGGAVLARAGWWPSIVLAAVGCSLVLLLLYASTYWTVGYAINIALAVWAWRAMQST